MPRSKQTRNELRSIDIYIVNKMISHVHVSLASVIISCMRDNMGMQKDSGLFGFSLLLTDIFHYFYVDDLGEQRKPQLTPTLSPVIHFLEAVLSR